MRVTRRRSGVDGIDDIGAVWHCNVESLNFGVGNVVHDCLVNVFYSNCSELFRVLLLACRHSDATCRLQTAHDLDALSRRFLRLLASLKVIKKTT